ncbi:MAG: helix-turn-helix domain-containing protein [Candidatus Acidiferrales bacterium]
MARGTFGERLKREREMREVSPTEITTATRISGRFLEALENEDWGKLPGGIFNRGFVRAIARYLGLDEESLLAEYDLAHGEQKIEAPAPYENPIPRPPKWIPILGILVFLGILLGLIYAGRYGWRRYAAHRAAKQSSTSILLSQPPSGSGNRVAADSLATSSSPASSSLDLSVSTSAATRVRIVGDGKLLLDTELSAGETRHFSATQQFEVTAGDSSAVLLELNGQAMPPLGAPGASGTIVLSQKDLRQAPGGTSQP